MSKKSLEEKMKGVWKDEEVKSLFKAVEDNKQAGKPTREAFETHAKKFGRKANSVRNYYYHELENLQSDLQRASRLEINLAEHKKNHFSKFSEEEKNNIICKIQEKLSQGYSVRKACLLLSGGDAKEMLRLQNKYRTNQAQPSNVIAFKKKQNSKITDADINELFMGLVKLIKKTALEEAKQSLSDQTLQSNLTIRKLVTQIGEKQRELSFLKEDYLNLKKENAMLKKKLLFATCLKAKVLTEKNHQA